MSTAGRGAPALSLPDELDRRRLRRRVLQITAPLVAIGLPARLALLLLLAAFASLQRRLNRPDLCAPALPT